MIKIKFNLFFNYICAKKSEPRKLRHTCYALNLPPSFSNYNQNCTSISPSIGLKIFNRTQKNKVEGGISSQKVILGTSISYTLIRKNVKNLNLRVKPSGHVILSAPLNISEKYIDSFMIAKATFVINALDKYSKATNVSHGTTTFSEGDTFYFLGLPYIVHLHRSNKAYVRPKDGVFHIYLKDIHDTKKKNSLVSAFLKASSKEFFITLLENIHPLFSEYHIPFPVLSVRNMKSRWGTCFYTKNSITLNSNLMTKPLPAIEYVIAHELAHFVEPNHSKAFYSILSNIMPDWKDRKKLLSSV